ncbi:pseudouridine synthase [Crenobacter cavernae]|uniref:Dual-specificity RNA pseudouridine synthase RluF n=1 Tax=Crenobacter cavernae TaxID=2290923 RepID=A0A345Y8Z1_9NEIS|nr:RNA pseudouridine synthase [Crenobacter cavernae]AXK40393.1 pseudouridylate synthase [Crenobacter cavernae]
MTDPQANDDTLRLSKRVTELARCSRREADELIEMGLVKVDGVVVDALGSRVRADQRIELAPRPAGVQADRVTLIVNKPAGYTLSKTRPGEHGVAELVVVGQRAASDRSGILFLKRHQQHLVSAGWLDNDATGLVVLTQDDGVANKLIKDATDFEQEYLVWLAEPLPPEALARLNAKRELEGKRIGPYKISRQSDLQLRVVVRQNRPRLVRGLVEAAGLNVTAIKRIRVGRIALGDLAEGQWRYLREFERF